MPSNSLTKFCKKEISKGREKQIKRGKNKKGRGRPERLCWAGMSSSKRRGA
jgi:hypothetical protein